MESKKIKKLLRFNKNLKIPLPLYKKKKKEKTQNINHMAFEDLNHILRLKSHVLKIKQNLIQP